MQDKNYDPVFFENLSRESLFSIFMNQVDFYVYFKDTNLKYVTCSSSFARLMGYATPASIVGKQLQDLILPEQADRLIAEEKRIMEKRTPSIGREEHIDLSNSKSSLSDIWLSTSIYPLTDRDGQICGIWGISRDISERKNTEQKLVQKNKQCDELNSKIHKLSTSDEVTGLYNRRYFEEMIARNMRLFSRVRGRGYSAGFSIVLMDIDGFTAFCTENGTQMRDEALKYIAGILLSCSRSSDDVFRVGNDEFALLLSDTNADGAQTVATRVREALKNKPFRTEKKAFHLTLSFGFSSFEDQLDASEMIMQADQSLFDAKAKRNQKKSSKKSES